MREAILYEKKEAGLVECRLCRQRCRILPDTRGICGVRENRDGKLYTLVYDRLAARNADPIEKKPFFHFHPGSLAYSIATMGCNFRCTHCQNCTLSQGPREHGVIEGVPVDPRRIVDAAVENRCLSISYTYSEPTIFAELALDTARAAKERGLHNTYVSNGYFTPEFLEEARGLIDAVNVDVKAFSDEFYRKICGARLDGVLDSLKRLRKEEIWIEVTTLLIPGLNDDPGELRNLAGFLADLDSCIPWHISRYHPAFRMWDRPATPLTSLKQAHKIGLEAGLNHVYLGNVPNGEGESTFCRSCGALLIKRLGFSTLESFVKDGRCFHCGSALAGRF